MCRLWRLCQRPRALSPQELTDLAPEAVVIDTRADRSAFMASHLPGALYSPLTKQFNTVVGSFVTDPAAPLVLIAPEARIEEAVRDLVRIGYDNITAYATYETLAAALQASGGGATIPEVSFDDVMVGAATLDVRRQAEYEAGHVPGASNIAHTRLAGRTDEVPEGSPLFVHCQSGARAAVAAAFLAHQGREVRYVNDGFAHYREIASGAIATGASEVASKVAA